MPTRPHSRIDQEDVVSEERSDPGSAEQQNNPDGPYAIPSVSSCAVRLGNLVFGKLVDGVPPVDPDGTSSGKYSRVSFVRRPW